MQLSFTLNGREVTHTAEPKRPAVDVLREDFGLTSLKPGCSPQGICGSCAAELNGKFRLTCTLPFKSLAGKELRTLEGLDEGTREQLAGAFEDATLCAYGTPGLVAHAALVGDGDVNKALHMHSCRTSWPHVKEAIGRIGAARPPEDSDVALGEEPFVGDLERPGMLHAALVFPPIAAGEVRVDASEVDARVFGPGELGLRMDGQALLSAHPQAVGRPCALVVAPSRHAARTAAAQVRVEVVRFAGAFVAEDSRVVLGSARDEDGNPLAPMTRSAHVTLSFCSTDPGCIEPEGALAVPTSEGLALTVNGTTLEAERYAAACAAGLDPAAVHVERLGDPPLLGGRSEPLVGPYAAAAAAKLGRPVKLCVSLEEGMAMHARRHACTVDLTLGADDHGSFTHLLVEVDADGGYEGDCEGFCARVVVNASGAYRIPNRSVSARAMETNNPPAGEVLGDGFVQVNTALELAVLRLAEDLGVAASELRRRNLAEDCVELFEDLDGALAVERADRGERVGRVIGAASVRVDLDDEGGIAQVQARSTASGPRAIALLAAGVGLSLTEQVETTEGIPDARLRNIGLIKARDLPEMSLQEGDWKRGDTGLLAATPAALMAAVAGFEAQWRSSFPMKDSEAAYSVGVRRPRKKR